MDLTLDVLGTVWNPGGGGGEGLPCPRKPELSEPGVHCRADWSQAAFWYAANFAGGQVNIQGLNMDSRQGDREVALDYWKLARPGDVELDGVPVSRPAAPLAAMAAVRAGEGDGVLPRRPAAD